MIQSAAIQPNFSTQNTANKYALRCLLIATLVICCWAACLSYLISIDISSTPIIQLLPLILVQTFLYTGLFITAHDAMHGVVFPKNMKINNFVGGLAVGLYALFSYKKLLKTHWQHHQNPATELDPDFHNGKQTSFLGWYFQFMKKYWSWWRLLGLISIFYLASYVVHLPERNLTLFWILPSILSSVQLFYFGTFLPHKEPIGGYKNIHNAQSNPLPIFWSFITCYHFGYHQEHHEYPNVPWWMLPGVYQRQGAALKN
ncbi:fatty acid desaturase [Gloeocapsopsis crepidinum LEGE 06123]|uniref:Fatty acid desaturase n=1 Tax=Gloeocapsopsis crepidinum LEGE 06123 TaxID=588587 RepID=A0ABR9UT52_9CHRO|nr:fatty acid desaturase [Gloeocapsopsis crepidinum]MBE9191449.1 fatty acid desaturase [Gloeocapsopsis crepidinum LEGE 06123]